MAFNVDEIRDLHGKWTKGGHLDAIKSLGNRETHQLPNGYSVKHHVGDGRVGATGSHGYFTVNKTGRQSFLYQGRYGSGGKSASANDALAMAAAHKLGSGPAVKAAMETNLGNKLAGGSGGGTPIPKAGDKLQITGRVQWDHAGGVSNYHSAMPFQVTHVSPQGVHLKPLHPGGMGTAVQGHTDFQRANPKPYTGKLGSVRSAPIPSTPVAKARQQFGDHIVGGPGGVRLPKASGAALHPALIHLGAAMRNHGAKQAGHFVEPHPHSASSREHFKNLVKAGHITQQKDGTFKLNESALPAIRAARAARAAKSGGATKNAAKDPITARNEANYRSAIVGARDFADKRQKGGIVSSGSRQQIDQGFAKSELAGSAGFQHQSGLTFHHPVLGTHQITRGPGSKYTVTRQKGATTTHADLPAAVAALRAAGRAARRG